MRTVPGPWGVLRPAGAPSTPHWGRFLHQKLVTRPAPSEGARHLCGSAESWNESSRNCRLWGLLRICTERPSHGIWELDGAGRGDVMRGGGVNENSAMCSGPSALGAAQAAPALPGAPRVQDACSGGGRCGLTRGRGEAAVPVSPSHETAVQGAWGVGMVGPRKVLVRRSWLFPPASALALPDCGADMSPQLRAQPWG